MKVLSVLAFAALVGIALSVCPSGCSGHGTCNAYDECTCFDEGKSTYFGYLYDTAKGYNRIKQDAMRALKTANSNYGMANSVTLTEEENDRFLDKEAYIQKQYTGPDCSQMTCPRGVSWSRPFNFAGDFMFNDPSRTRILGGEVLLSNPPGSVTNHAGLVANDATPGFNQCRHADFAECSDAGICDRSSGMCECFEGYEGAACQRTTCPNSCSGHGQCQSNIAFSKDGSLARSYSNTGESDFTITENSKQVDPRKYYEGAWDSGIHYGCKCDIGFRGEDCSLVECPSSSDPQGWYGNESGEDCSGRGMCDYGTGECTCFTGYTGVDCGTIEALA